MPDATLFLTRISPEPSSALARRELRNAGLMHHRVMSLLPNGLGPNPRASADVLFRVDEDRAGTFVLLQSTLRPDPAAVPVGYGHLVTRDMAPLLAACPVGTRVDYRLIANAVRRTTRTNKATPLRSDEAEAWWHERASAGGLHIESTHLEALAPASHDRNVAGTQSPQRTAHDRIRFDGTATVTDHDALKQFLTLGVGRAKSYGCGLLTIAPRR